MNRNSDARTRRLEPILLSLCVVAGIVVAVSYLWLGHVFVANMTGNVIFFGFALAARLAESSGVSIDVFASVYAVVAFVSGAGLARLVLERKRAGGVTNACGCLDHRRRARGDRIARGRAIRTQCHRRVAAVAAMLGGAILGAAIVLKIDVTTALVVAGIAPGMVGALARRPPPNMAIIDEMAAA